MKLDTNEFSSGIGDGRELEVGKNEGLRGCVGMLPLPLRMVLRVLL